MASDWYCRIGGREFGPLSSDDLRTMVAEGSLTPRHKVKRGEGGSWFDAAEVNGLFASPDAVAAEPAAVGAGSAHPAAARTARAAERPPPPPPPTALPQAQEVPAPPAIAVAGHMAQPVAARPIPTSAATGFGIAVDAPPSSAAARDALPKSLQDTKRRNQQQFFIMVLCGLFGAAAILGGAFAYKVSQDDKAAAKKEKDRKDSKKEDESADKKPDKGDKSDAAEPYDLAKEAPVGDATVKIDSVDFAQQVQGTTGTFRGNPEFLVVKLTVRNAKKSGNIDYTGWAKIGSSASMTDQAKGKVALASFSGGVPKGQVDKKVEIAPGESVSDVLVFTKPPDTAKTLKLQLPGAAVGGKAAVAYQIPVAKINVAARVDHTLRSPERPVPGKRPPGGSDFNPITAGIDPPDGDRPPRGGKPKAGQGEDPEFPLNPLDLPEYKDLPPPGTKPKRSDDDKVDAADMFGGGGPSVPKVDGDKPDKPERPTKPPRRGAPGGGG